MLVYIMPNKNVLLACYYNHHQSVKNININQNINLNVTQRDVCFTDMASKLNFVLVTWMLVFILMEESKLVLGKGGKLKKLQARMEAVEEHIAKEGECQGNVYNLKNDL